ncbi:MAG: uracil-DNA glycosylase family protein [Syntrophales bacterium]|nr:uracil-DNA glycosylase family protein [Syntrophales bacterium]
MTSNQMVSVREQLLVLASIIDSHRDWWRFPTEDQVQGFLGDDPLFIVGDQPSTSPWKQSHPNRRAFYDTLYGIGASRAHLTDLYKRRGRSGELRGEELPEDFKDHLKFFEREIDIVRPKRIVALGNVAYELLFKYLPGIRGMLSRMWHFSYVVRAKKVHEYEANMRNALTGIIPSITAPEDSSPTLEVIASDAQNYPRKSAISPFAQIGCATTYSSSRLCFRAKEIEPLDKDDKFCVVTADGPFVMTKRDFYWTFPRVVQSNSYKYGRKEYHYPSTPQRARRFLVHREPMPDSFIDLVRAVHTHNWCTLENCCTCGANDYRQVLKQLEREADGGLPGALAALNPSELTLERNWKAALHIAVSDFLSSIQVESILKAWWPKFHEDIAFSDFVLYKILRYAPKRNDIRQKWLDACIILAKDNRSFSLIESLLLVLRKAAFEHAEIIEIAKEYAKSSGQMRRVLRNACGIEMKNT